MSTKELGKYEVVPTIDQLMAIIEFFEKHVTSTGRVNFTQRQMLESTIVSSHFSSPSYLNGVTTYLVNEGYITKVEVGSRHHNSVWDVNKLLKDWENVITREELGASRPTRDENEKLIIPGNVEVEVVRNEEKAPQQSKGIRREEVHIVSSKAAAPVEDKAPAKTNVNNESVFEQLRNTMSDMMGYLQNLPIEMGGHLRSIANQLELTDEQALIKLQEENKKLRNDNKELQEKYGSLQVKLENNVNQLNAQNKNLEEEINGLKAQLEEANNKPTYDEHHIYRQRNAIMDEVDRMLSAPAWSFKQNGVNYRNTIEAKLNIMMSELGIEN